MEILAKIFISNYYRKSNRIMKGGLFLFSNKGAEEALYWKSYNFSVLKFIQN